MFRAWVVSGWQPHLTEAALLATHRALELRCVDLCRSGLLLALQERALRKLFLLNVIGYGRQAVP